MKAKTTANLPPPRVVNLYLRFTPDGPDCQDQATFLSFCYGAPHSKLLDTELPNEEARPQKLGSAGGEASSLQIEAQKKELLGQMGPQKITTALFEEDMVRGIFEFCTERMRGATSREDAKRLQQEFPERLEGAWTSAMCGLTSLADAANEGNALAATFLVGAAIDAVRLLGTAAGTNAAVMRPIARNLTIWPVLANDEPGWEKGAEKLIEELELGAANKSHFRHMAGDDAFKQPRRWAKAAVRTIEETRKRFLRFLLQVQFFVGSMDYSGDDVLRFIKASGWRVAPLPKWVKHAAILPPFSAKSLSRWQEVMKAMIPEQLPDFHTYGEWKAQLARKKPGAAKAAILDRIRSAMETIVPR
jgi:hypothetical protein